MKEIIEAFFKQRSLVNHQLASYDDCIPSSDNTLSRMEKIVRSIRVGTDEDVVDEEGGLIKLDVLDQNIVIRVKNIQPSFLYCLVLCLSLIDIHLTWILLIDHKI